MRKPDAAGDCRVPADKGGESAVDLRVERVVDVVEALVERLAALAEVEALFLLVAAATGSDGTSTSRELRTYWLSSSPPASPRLCSSRHTWRMDAVERLVDR